METTYNQLNEPTRTLLSRLSAYLEGQQFYYFGSVQRIDYFPNGSDVDIDIFCNNEHSVMSKMQHFFHASKHDFAPFVWIIRKRTTYGYKYKYQDKQNRVYIEFSIYNNAFKELVLSEHIHKTVLPMYAICMLVIIKFLFYTLRAISGKTYSSMKRYVLSYGIGQEDEDKFLLI